jgi:primosomal replication protein N
MYLQNGRSLTVAEGKHLVKTPLNDKDLMSVIANNPTVSIPVEAGDIVVMDIRLPHRGSTEEQMAREQVVLNPKILISTVFGGNDRRLTHQMMEGNLARLIDWDKRPEFSDINRLD